MRRFITITAAAALALGTGSGLYAGGGKGSSGGHVSHGSSLPSVSSSSYRPIGTLSTQGNVVSSGKLYPSGSQLQTTFLKTSHGPSNLSIHNGPGSLTSQGIGSKSGMTHLARLTLSGPSKGMKDYQLKYGSKFSHGYCYYGKGHCQWTYSCYWPLFGCSCYWDPFCCSWYYWCEPAGCYYPVSYARIAAPTAVATGAVVADHAGPAPVADGGPATIIQNAPMTPAGDEPPPPPSSLNGLPTR